MKIKKIVAREIVILFSFFVLIVIMFGVSMLKVNAANSKREVLNEKYMTLLSERDHVLTQKDESIRLKNEREDKLNYFHNKGYVLPTKNEYLMSLRHIYVAEDMKERKLSNFEDWLVTIRDDVVFKEKMFGFPLIFENQFMRLEEWLNLGYHEFVIDNYLEEEKYKSFEPKLIELEEQLIVVGNELDNTEYQYFDRGLIWEDFIIAIIVVGCFVYPLRFIIMILFWAVRTLKKVD